MDGLLQKLLTLPEIQEINSELAQGTSPILVTGLSSVHRSMVCSAVWPRSRPLLVLCAEEKEASRQALDLQSLTGVAPVILHARPWHFGRADAMSRTWEHQRLSALYRIACGEAPLVVATVEAVVQKGMARTDLLEKAFTLVLGRDYDVTTLTQRLVQAGYTRYDQIEGPGQFAVRGGILDVFSPQSPAPVRCEFFGDTLDAMGTFCVDTQRRSANCDTALILPAAEDAGGSSFTQTVFDYLPEDCLIAAGEGSRILENLREWYQQGKDGGDADLAHFALTESQWTERLRRYTLLEMESLPTSRHLLPPRSLYHINVKQLSTYGGSLETACNDIVHYTTAGYGVLVLCGGEVRCRNMHRLLEEKKIRAVLDFTCQAPPGKSEIRIGIGALSGGSEWPESKLAVLTEGQLTDSVVRSKKNYRFRDTNTRKIQSYTDLTPGDLVVHVHHGIGRFEGLLRMPVDGVKKDYMKIAYAGSDCLYVPCTAMDLVSKYIGGGEEGERQAKLNKLGGTEWAKTTYRAKAAAKDLAEGLIRLYARRQRLGGFAFSPDSPWQQEFEESFPYEETEDQLRCAAEIKADMERPVPMDRLLCGDVGYGKTEVALRAAMKCILDGKQAALLVPTTVLAQQHYATAVSRFRSFPVNIEVLSRFRTPKQVKSILQRLAAGQVDLLIGTHKLLQKDVTFRDLGLLIVDEEQRFGVEAKEKLREKYAQVDTLTLSATPIPRTLNMSLSGIRDMSTIEEPPQDRQTVQTYVLEHDWGAVAKAIERELDRGGQVYYLHNRVETIDSTAFRLGQLLPEGTVIGVAHGKMTEKQLSDAMRGMTEGETQVLVCTTIIEAGIDIPNVNTMIIEDADHLGLAQLHQIRGRIGRSARRAYAYLTYRPGKVLTEVAAKRLSAIREFVEFGSGFKIAMRDLEIRGAGNLLGPEQSGYMMSVGYDMYLKLLNDAVLEQQGKARQIRPDCTADLTVSAHIPQEYITSAEQRMDLYRRIAAIRSPEDREDVLDEMLDRYGEPPKAVMALLEIALLRTDARNIGVCDITQKGQEIIFTFRSDFPVEAVAQVCAMAQYRQLLRLYVGEKPQLILRLRSGEDPLAGAEKLVEYIGTHTSQISGDIPGKEENRNEEI